MACKIIYNSDKSVKEVLAPNGKESILYKSLLESLNGDSTDALKKWVSVYLTDFKQSFGDWENNKISKDKLDENGEPLIQYIEESDTTLLETIETGDTPILEVREKEFIENAFIERISEIETDSFQIESLVSVDDRLDKVYSKLQDSLDHQLKLIKRFDSKKKSKDLTKRIKNIADIVEKYSDTNKVRGVLHYINSINKEIKNIENSLSKKANNNQDMVRTLENYKKYLSLFSVIDDIHEIFKDSVELKDINTNKRINNKILAIKGTHDNIQRRFVSITRSYLAKNLNDIKFHQKVEAKWKEKLERLYNDMYAGNNSKLKDKGSKKNWINKKLIEYRPEIQKDVEKATKELIYNKAFDITYFSQQFLSAFETNSDIVQIVQQELTQVRDNIIEEMRDVESELSKEFSKFKKENGNYNPEKQFNNILDKSSTGNYFLKGTHKIEFMEKQNDYIEYLAQLDETEGDERKIIEDKIKLLQSELYIVKGGKPVEVKVKWKNDLSKLTDSEKSALDTFKNIINKSSKDMLRINTLKYQVNITKNSPVFYKLPSVTKTDLERILGGNAKGTFTDKLKDLTTVRPDDIGYEQVKANSSGEIVREIPIHLRGNIDASQQSLDLFTIFKMEAQNGVAFKHRKEKEMFLEMIIDMATNKEYYQTKGLSFTPLLNKFAQRNKDLATKGNDNNNTVKKLKGIMDAQLYDITKKYQGKIAGKDVQKMVGFINGYTGMLGMSLNYHSALVNLSGGYAQFLIHAMSNDVINMSNIKKALSVYTKNTKSTLKDINDSTDKSFTNQINIMFDTFGGYTVGTNSFLKDKGWKKFANLHGLTAMHQMGEHQLQSVITMAVLDSVDALDKDGNNYNGSILDNLEMSNGKVILNKNVIYNSHSPLTEWSKGGKVQVQQLIKYKIFQTLGNYDDNLQPEIMKTAQGRLLMMFRRFFLPLAMDRLRGVNKAFTDKKNIKEHEKFFSNANKRFEEGSYVTTVRYIVKNVIPHLKSMKLKLMMSDYQQLTDYEKSNIHKATIEFATAILLGILSSMIAKAAKDDDDELLYFLAYTMRRTESELKQFWSLQESYRITKTPFASIRTLESTTNLLGLIVNPMSWNDRYKSGKRKGDLKLIRQVEKMIPVWSKLDRQNSELYNYLESSFLSM